MHRKKRWYIKKPQLRLFDTTGLTQDVQSSLNIAIWAVTLSMVFTNITVGPAWTGYQRMLGADAFTLGVLSAIPVTASTLQIFASYILERWRARKTLFMVFGTLSRVSWVLIALIPVIIPGDMQSTRLLVLMVLLAVSAIGGAFINVSFFSLMGDLVPMRIRGRYFSARQAVALVAGIATGLCVSWIMDKAEGFTGYVIVLTVAGLFGVADIFCFLKVKWPIMEKKEGKQESLLSMIRSVLADAEYMKIVGYFTLWFFSVNISAPFTNVYFLEHVRMTFTEMTLFNQIVSNVSTVIIISWWGRQMDRFGNQPIIQTAGLYCMILPFTYIFTGPRSFAILPFAHLLSGMAWPASDLGQQNMYLGKAPGKNRSMYVAVFFTCTQLFGTALSNFIGGILMDGPMLTLEGLGWRLFGFDVTRYNYMFMLSGILRVVCVVVLLPHLRQAGDIPVRQMWKEIIGQFAGWIRRWRHGIRIKYIRSKYRKENNDVHEEDN